MKKKDMQSMVRLMLTPVLMVILGIVLVVRPDSASALVGKVLGWVLLVVGIGLLVESIAVKELTTSRILFVVVAAALGLWLVRNPLRLAAALGRVAGLLILVRAVQDIINAARWKCGMKYALLSAIIGGLLILLPMTTSRAVWVIVGLLVIAVGVLMAIDRLKPGKLLGDGGIDVVVFPGQSRRRLGGGGGTAGVHQQCNARLGQGSGQKLCPVRIKGPVIHMGVGIKQHFSILSQRSWPQGIRPIPRPGGPGG